MTSNINHMTTGVAFPGVIFQGNNFNVTIPKTPLIRGSVKIELQANTSEQLGKKTDREAYVLMQKILEIWQKRGITDYLLIRKNTSEINASSWEMIPYSKDEWHLWHNFRILWSAIFGGSILSKSEREELARDYNSEKRFLSSPWCQSQKINNKVHSDDILCQKVENQFVHKGRKVNLLYSSAPNTLGKDQLHFLLMPKAHRASFSALRYDEFQEQTEISRKLINHFREKGYKMSYEMDKSGKHSCREIVFIENSRYEILGKLLFLKNLLFGSKDMSKVELKKRITALRNDLAAVL